MRKLQIVGHRGAAGLAPENTIPAFEEAKKYHVDYIEFDVRETRDGHLILMHDEDVSRTTNGRGSVRDMDLAQIKQLDAGSWFSHRYRNTRVPTLAEALEVLRSDGIGIIIELKDRNIEKKTLVVVEESDLLDRVIIASFAMNDLINTRRINDTVQLAIISPQYNQRILEQMERLGIGMLALEKDAVDRYIIRRCREEGILLDVGTVNDIREAERLIGMGVDIICTDYPDRIYVLRKRFAGRCF